MKRLFSILALSTATQGITQPTPVIRSELQRKIIFTESEVPVFVITGQKDKQTIVIDRSHLKSSVKVH